MDIGVQPFLISATLLGVVAQRLVRTLCPLCKRPGTVLADAWQALVAPHRTALPTTVMAPAGCDECRHTGFRGRAGIYEIMRLEENLSQLIKADMHTAQLRQAALKAGMRPLRLAGAVKMADGLSTLEEVLSVVPAAER